MDVIKLKHYDGSTSSRNSIEEEVPFPEGKLIVSRTDTFGNITHCNQAFVEMSGFEENEIIGRPHHILRHPDMPAGAFKDLWKTVKGKEKWSGYVKNLRKDGRYYWVYAVVVPNIRKGEVVGYASVRRKPSRTKINECIELYKTMLEQEKGQ
ncbi:MAG: PAS domain-containing protein [Proteobacteria bacterium]|nr:PAS domain-containing protein [Pseudomonadota bacterium]